MKKIIFALVLSLALVGCNTVPVKKNFPEPPAELMKPPEELKLLPKEPLVLSNVTKSVFENYNTAAVNKLQLEKLQEWIKKQLDLYNSKP